MVLESLLLSRDPEVIGILRPTLEKLSIDLQVCNAARPGLEMLASEKFDAIIVDCDDLEGGLNVLGNLRKGTSNRSSVAFAILNGTTTTHQAFDLGANFVIQKPITPVSALRCFSAAVGFMERERRRYFRHPLEIPVAVIMSRGGEAKAITTNLSEGGMAVRFPGNLPAGGISKVVFTLPGMQLSMESNVELAWADGHGLAGLRFSGMAQTSREQLERWLLTQMEKTEAQRQP
jgi:CheY-like chemotaxis protein